MGKDRLGAFSDGVIAVIVTIMVLELEPPHGATLATLRPLVPVFLAYVLSFVYVAVDWNHRHPMFFAAEKIGGAVMWGNLIVLLMFVHAWIAELRHARVASMGIVPDRRIESRVES